MAVRRVREIAPEEGKASLRGGINSDEGDSPNHNFEYISAQILQCITRGSILISNEGCCARFAHIVISLGKRADTGYSLMMPTTPQCEAFYVNLLSLLAILTVGRFLPHAR